MRKTNNIVGATWGRGNDAPWKSPTTGLSHRAWKSLPRFPHCHRHDGCYTLSEFKTRKDYPSPPSPILQAHPWIGKDWRKKFLYILRFRTACFTTVKAYCASLAVALR